MRGSFRNELTLGCNRPKPPFAIRRSRFGDIRSSGLSRLRSMKSRISSRYMVAT